MAEFTWINKQGIESTQGFSVQRTGRFTAEYKEGTKKLLIDVESGIAGGAPCLHYCLASFDSWSSEPEERKRVAFNFRRALEFKGYVPIET